MRLAFGTRLAYLRLCTSWRGAYTRGVPKCSAHVAWARASARDACRAVRYKSYGRLAVKTSPSRRGAAHSNTPHVARRRPERLPTWRPPALAQSRPITPTRNASQGAGRGWGAGGEGRPACTRAVHVCDKAGGGVCDKAGGARHHEQRTPPRAAHAMWPQGYHTLRYSGVPHTAILGGTTHCDTQGYHTLR